MPERKSMHELAWKLYLWEGAFFASLVLATGTFWQELTNPEAMPPQQEGLGLFPLFICAFIWCNSEKIENLHLHIKRKKESLDFSIEGIMQKEEV